MKLVQKFCCGCSVKTGALIICYFTLIQAVVPILNILSNTSSEIVNDKHLSNEYKRHIMWFAVVTIVIVSHALFGIYKKKAGYMMPFLMYKLMILFVLTMMLGFAPAVVKELKSMFPAGAETEDDALPGFIVTILTVIGLEAYSILILFSHYTNMRHEIRQSAANPSNVGFTSAVPEMENAAPYPTPYTNDLPKKQPPPPYAV